MVEALDQIIDSIDSVCVEAFFVDDDAWVIVDALADASHKRLILGHAPNDELIVKFVLLVVIGRTDARPGRLSVCLLLQIEIMSD